MWIVTAPEPKNDWPAPPRTSLCCIDFAEVLALRGRGYECERATKEQVAKLKEEKVL